MPVSIGLPGAEGRGDGIATGRDSILEPIIRIPKERKQMQGFVPGLDSLFHKCLKSKETSRKLFQNSISPERHVLRRTLVSEVSRAEGRR